MKTLILTLLCLTLGYCSIAQINISESAYLHAKQARIKITDLSLVNDGNISSDSASLLELSSSKTPMAITGSEELHFNTIAFSGNISCATDIHLVGDLIAQSGVLQMQADKTLFLGSGSLIGENNDRYVIGTISKTITLENSDKTIAMMGLEGILSAPGRQEVNVTRHSRYRLRNTSSGTDYVSLNRVYQFQPDVQLARPTYEFLAHENGNKVARPIMYYFSAHQWVKCSDQKYDAKLQKVQASSVLTNVSAISAFPPDDLRYSKYITANNDGVSDYFYIEGLVEYPNNRLVVLNKSGKILFDQVNYQNDFTAQNLPAGTYYYVFYVDDQVLTKSYFEVIK